MPSSGGKVLTLSRERLMDHRFIDDHECWNWTLARTAQGYGKIRHLGRDYTVHRVAAMLWLGLDLASKRCALHHCDNPGCFNPEHLYVGTQRENYADAVHRRRLARGHTNSLVKVTRHMAAMARIMHLGGWREVDIAAYLGLGQSHVSRILLGKVRHLVG